MSITEFSDPSLRFFSDFAKSSGREIFATEESQKGNALHGASITVTKFVIPEKDDISTFLIGVYNPKTPGINELIFGFFIPVDAPKDFSLKLKQRSIIDKINPFAKKSYFRSGSEDFDSTFNISTNNENQALRILNNRAIQKSIFSCTEIEKNLIFGVNELNLDFVRQLEGKSHFGIFTRQEWIMDNNKINNLWREANMIKENINT